MNGAVQLQVYVHGGAKRQLCINLVTYQANLMCELSSRPNLWSYVAESYVECTITTFHALQRSAPASNDLLPVATVHSVICMLVKLLNDKRVVSPYMKEIMLSSVNMLFSQPGYLLMVENDAHALEHLVPTLLGAYTQDLWMLLSTILMRLLEGSGFGSVQDPTKGSEPLRKRLACVCLMRTPQSTAFVNQLFSSLNWAITELTMTLRDSDSAVPHALQRRQHVLFEFAVHSCRLLDFLFVHAPLLFMTGPHINAARLCEMLAFVISHIDAQEGSRGQRQLAAVLRADSDKLHPLHLLAPVVSVLMYAWHLEFKGGLADAVQEQHVLQNEARFSTDAVPIPDHIEHSIVHMLGNMKEACSTERLECLAKCDWSKALGADWAEHTPKHHPYCYPEFLDWIREWRAAGSDAPEHVPDDFLDPIMMCVMEDPVILPDSKVTVDRSTIVRHLLGSQTDPFSRLPLSLSDVTPNTELRQRLREWRLTHARTQTAAALAATAAATPSEEHETPPVAEQPAAALPSEDLQTTSGAPESHSLASDTALS